MIGDAGAGCGQNIGNAGLDFRLQVFLCFDRLVTGVPCRLRCRFRTSVTLEVQYIGNTFWAESGKRSAHALEEE